MMHAQQVAPAKSRGAPCALEHSTVKASEEQWAAMPFAGIQPLGPQLFECRHCPICDSTVQRLVSLARALELLFDDLVSNRPPLHSSVRSAALLIPWVAQNAPPMLGVLVPTAASAAGKLAGSR